MTAVEIADCRLTIDGVPRVLLCSSLFPFRIARSQWRSRIRAVAALGYHCLDVYFPWNHFEISPGVWDFTGERDMAHFLELARDEGLLVLARPGPYVCSEWDGGGLPAWLTQDPDLRVRQNEPRFLGRVEEWFDHILPILGRHQATEGGPIALVQLENELDFFDCDDPSGYVAALRDMARRHGIEVPLIACAGQGDGARATGAVEGVTAAFNLYPSDESTDIEAQVAYVEAAARLRDAPLIVTETNRLHRTLRRLLGSGVKVLGPYLQVSGWNVGYRSVSVNNWGSPLALMAHDYDFGGVIAPDGTERADAGEARSLGALIDALGPRLGSSTPIGEATGITGRLSVPPMALALAEGGELLSLTNLEHGTAVVSIDAGDRTLEVHVPAASTRLLVRGVPLQSLGIDGEIALSSAELGVLARRGDTVHVGVQVDLPATVLLRLPDARLESVDGDLTVDDTDGLRVWGTGGEVRARTAGCDLVLTFAPRPVAAARDDAPVSTLTTVGVASYDEASFWDDIHATPGPDGTLERHGVFDGAARYTTSCDLSGVHGLVLGGAADVVTVRSEGFSPAWFGNGGCDVWVPTHGTQPVRLNHVSVEVRVWGHSNFDDSHLPSLRLGSTRGLRSALAVTSRSALDEGWVIDDEGSSPEVGDLPMPRIGWGGWVSARFPQTIRLRRTLTLPDGATGAALALDDAGGHHRVSVDGVDVGTLTPISPVLLLGAVSPGSELVVTSTRAWGEPVGSLRLIAGVLLDTWSMQVAGEQQVLAAAGRSVDAPTGVPLPVVVEPGQPRWVTFDAGGDGARDAIVRVTGTGLHLTFVVAGQVLARLWTQEPPGARVKGGRGDVVVIPADIARHSQVSVLLEAIGQLAGRLDAVRLGGSIDEGRPD